MYSTCKTTAVFLLGLLALTACSSSGTKEDKAEIVLLPAEGDAAYLVIPFNDSLAQRRFASEMESFLAKIRFRVIKPRSASEAGAQDRPAQPPDVMASSLPPNHQAASWQANRVAQFAGADAAQAEYVIFTLLYENDSATVLVTRHQDGAILGAAPDVDPADPEDLVQLLERLHLLKRVTVRY